MWYINRLSTTRNAGLRYTNMTIAPHINSEVRLVLGGHKQLGTIEKRKDPLGYALAISMCSTGALAMHVEPTEDSPEGEVVITLPCNSQLIPEYYWLLKEGVKELGIKEYHRRMGEMFGYSKADIEEFINSSIQCECNKCKGY